MSGSSSNFQKTLETFCQELQTTYPELEAAITRARTTVTPSIFWRSWQRYLGLLQTPNADVLFSERRGILIAPIQLTPTLWEEVSETSHTAIWRFLRTLLLNSIMEEGVDARTMTPEQKHAITFIMSEERLFHAEETGDASEGEAAIETIASEILREEAGGMMERLRNILKAASAADASGGAAAAAADMPPLPEIPAHLRNGKIAKLAQDMAKQFKPEEFGIDPAMLTVSGDNVGGVLRQLAEMYQRDPSVLIAGAKRMAERIQRQVMGGSIKQEDLIAEAREFVELFKEHPLFKEAIAKFQEMVGEGGLGELLGGLGGGSAGAPSDRLRAVQERLRKKMAARQAKK